MFDFSSNSQRACSARAFLFLRESAVPDRRWVRRVRPLMANRELSRQGSQHSPNDGDPCEGAVMRCRRSRVGVANPDSITTIVGAWSPRRLQPQEGHLFHLPCRSGGTSPQNLRPSKKGNVRKRSISIHPLLKSLLGSGRYLPFQARCPAGMLSCRTSQNWAPLTLSDRLAVAEETWCMMLKILRQSSRPGIAENVEN